jgi:hypothetical protein
MADSREGRTELSAAALQEWSAHVENVLRGVAHALNNRAAALSAVMELSRDPTEGTDVVGSILSSEMERVTELVAVVRSVGVPKQTVEAFAPAEVAETALAVLKIHAEQRDRKVVVEGAGSPLRVPRWMFLRALVALVASVPGESDAMITMVQRNDWLEVSLSASDAPSGLTPLVSELARAMQGEALADRYGFRVPTLALLRRSEGRAD